MLMHPSQNFLPVSSWQFSAYFSDHIWVVAVTFGTVALKYKIFTRTNSASKPKAKLALELKNDMF